MYIYHIVHKIDTHEIYLAAKYAIQSVPSNIRGIMWVCEVKFDRKKPEMQEE